MLVSYTNAKTGNVVNIKGSKMLRKIWNLWKYRKELTDLKVYSLTYTTTEAGSITKKLVRVNYLVGRIGTETESLLKYDLRERYYISVQELLLSNADSKDSSRLYLPSMYYQIRLLVIKYEANILKLTEIQAELKELNRKTLKILHAIV